MATKKAVINGKQVRLVCGWITKLNPYGDVLEPAVRIDLPCKEGSQEKGTLMDMFKKKGYPVVYWSNDEYLKGCYYIYFENPKPGVEPKYPYYCYESEVFVLEQYDKGIPTYASATTDIFAATNSSFSNVG